MEFPSMCSSLLLVLLTTWLSTTLCLTAEPECPFGSPKIDLADVDGRCDRYWMCEDGMISDMYCSSGSGFDPNTKRCDQQAPCIRSGNGGTNKDGSGLGTLFNIFTTKSVSGSASRTGMNTEAVGKTIQSVMPFVSSFLKLFS